MNALSDSFRALSDTTRLRVLRCLAASPLNVTELVQVLGVGQSNVSHHLARLKRLGLVAEERQGSAKLFSLIRGSEGSALGALVRMAVEWKEDDFGDLARLREALRTREDRQTLNERLLEPGQSWLLWGRAVASLLPAVDAADFGCGSGVLTVEMARWARTVTAIDASPAALAKAKARAAAAGTEVSSRIRFVQDDLLSLRMPKERFDLVVLSQSLHHVEDPPRAIGTAWRVLRPGGRLVVLELLPHKEGWVVERLGHRWLGFEPAAVRRWTEDVGFSSIDLDESAARPGDPFRVFRLGATKSARPQRALAPRRRRGPGRGGPRP